MIRLITLLIIGLSFFASYAQDSKSTSRENLDYEADKIAKEATTNILNYIGLPPDFKVVQLDIPNVIAYTKHRDRYIGYNPKFIQRLRIQSETDWSAYSVLAHEIGHHLAGHTQKSGRSNPGNELVADHFSGFILQRMGATLAEAESALLSLEEIGGISDTIHHPPIHSRITSLAEGWMQAASLNLNCTVLEKVETPEAPTSDRYLYKCTFNGDENVYYINQNDQVIWFNERGRPIEIGKKLPSETTNFAWNIRYGRSIYGVDAKGVIWSTTNYSSSFKVGVIDEFTYDPKEGEAKSKPSK